MADARHDLPADAPALFEAALATLPPETAVIPSARGRHPALHPAALGLLLDADRPFRAAIRLASRTGSASLPNALARPWRSSALLGAARRDAHRALMLLALAATPIGLVGWTNTGATPSSLRLRGRPGVHGALGRDAAVAALRRLLAETPPAVLEIPPPLSRHARLRDAEIFGPDGRAAVAAAGQRLFLRRQHGMAALGILDRTWEPRLLALASDPGAE